MTLHSDFPGRSRGQGAFLYSCYLLLTHIWSHFKNQSVDVFNSPQTTKKKKNNKISAGYMFIQWMFSDVSQHPVLFDKHLNDFLNKPSQGHHMAWGCSWYSLDSVYVSHRKGLLGSRGNLVALIHKIYMSKYDHEVCLVMFLHKAGNGDQNGTRHRGQFAPVLVFIIVMLNNRMSIFRVPELQFHIALLGNSLKFPWKTHFLLCFVLISYSFVFTTWFVSFDLF